MIRCDVAKLCGAGVGGGLYQTVAFAALMVKV